MNRSITLPELSSHFLEALRTYGYSEDSLKRFSKVLRELCEYAKGECYSQKMGAEFLSQIFHDLKGLVRSGEHSKTEMYYLRTIRALNKYWYFGTLFRNETCLGPIIWPEEFADAVYGFLEEKAAYRCSEGTIRQYERAIQDFLLFLEAGGIHSLSEITPMLISRYIASLTGYAPKTVAGRVSHLKGWFQYLFLKGCIQEDLTAALPKARGSFREKLPVVWTQEDIEKILSSVDLGNPVGRRDYAMLLLMARLGLRVSDVKNLKLTDVDWQAGEVTFLQAKTNKALTLPLPEDAGWAIIRYLQSGRPVTECPNLFVRHVPPFDAFSDYTKFYGMMARLIAKAGIPPEKRQGGVHSLRHSLATNLLRGQVDPSTISHILGHTDPKTAKYYLRVDIPDLRLCALDVEVACHE